MIATIEMYQLQCDNCNEAFIDEHNGFVAWTDKDSAREMALDSEGWIEIEQKSDTHYCPECFRIEVDDDGDDMIIVDANRTKKRSKD